MTAPAPARTSRRSRLERQEDVSRELGRILDQVGITRAQAAVAAGVPEQRGRDWADPEVDRHLSLADALAQDPRVRVQLAELLLEGADRRIVSAIPATPATLRDTIQLFGAALSALGASEADGWVSPSEAQTDVAAIRLLRVALDQLEQHRLEAIRARGLRVAIGGRTG